MVVVKVELWPKGSEKGAREIARALIWNDGTGDAKVGNYKAALLHSGIFYGKPGFWKRGAIKGHQRMLSPYHLIVKAIAACLGRN